MILLIVIGVVAALAAAELAVRALLASQHGTLRTGRLWQALRSPQGGTDWRIYASFGEIDERRVADKFRFASQAAYMGMAEDRLIEIMAHANRSDPATIRRVYTGAHAFEKSRYRPFVGFSTRPNQALSYATIDAHGFQGGYKTSRKPPNTRRALLLGGSVAFGIGCTAPEKGLTFKLEEILNRLERDRGSDVRWEIVNIAFVGAQSISEHNQILLFASLFSPDVIVHLSGFNDLYFFLNDSAKLFTYPFYEGALAYLSSSLYEKCLMALARRLFLVKGLVRLSTLRPKTPEGQLYTVW